MSPIRETSDIHVVFAADANYVVPLTVALVSATVNCSRPSALRFHVIQSGITPELQMKVERSLQRAGFADCKVEWLSAPLERLRHLEVGPEHTTSLTFARLLIADLLAPDVEKAIYLDCDVVVRDDIAELWRTDLADKSLWAVRDFIAFVSSPSGLANYRDLAIPPTAHYFNAGVLLLNLKKWRALDIGPRVLAYLAANRAIVKMADQEGLNAVLWNDWGELDFRWNSQIMWRNYRLGKAVPIWVPHTTRQSITHFTTAEKPWLPGCDYDEKRFFFQFLDLTEWANWRVSRWDELYARSRRAVSDLRDAVGRLRMRFNA